MIKSKNFIISFFILTISCFYENMSRWVYGAYVVDFVAHLSSLLFQLPHKIKVSRTIRNLSLAVPITSKGKRNG